MLQFRKAVRKAVPMLIGLSGPSGSGKTFSGLLLAAGIAGDKGRVAMIDTENGRGQMYCDSPTIIKAFPSGFEYARLDPPFSPQAYMEGIDSAEKAGITVAVVDSSSHEWEGIGGCEEIAEKHAIKGQPNWKVAKMAHKRFMMRCLASSMHIVFCLRAREKVKYVKVNGKTEVVQLGIQPICEKNFMFEMLVSMRVEEETHHAVPVKVPEPLVYLFPKSTRITKDLGIRIRQWNDTGSPLPEFEQVQKRARLAAEDGVTAYREFYGTLTPKQKQALRNTTHDENKQIATAADAERETSEASELTEEQMREQQKLALEEEAKKERK
jgi:hypothetical protein